MSKRILTEEQKEKKRIRDRKYAEKNKERWIRWKKKHFPNWQPNSSTKIRKKSENERKESENERKRKYHLTQKGRAVNLCGSYKYSDKKYNRGECTLTAEWIVENIFTSKCSYCGKDDWRELGCDRIDNSKPHTPNNVVCCCQECNTKRGNKSYEEFLKEMRANSSPS